MSTTEWKDLRIGEILLQLGEDLTREGLRDTPDRVERSWLEFFEGYTLKPEDILNKHFSTESESDEGEAGIVLCHDIEFTSMCEHHLLPFFGVCHVAYKPKDHVVGLSKLARLVDVFSKRLQIQERMTNEIAQSLYKITDAEGVAVICNAKHLCCHGRGVRRKKMEFLTTAIRGNISLAEITNLLEIKNNVG